MAITESEPGANMEIARLQHVWSQIDTIMRRCRVPSVSIGVTHRGTRVLTKGLGELDPRQVGRPPDERTLYTLCSTSKTFVSAALGILVADGKLKWTDTVGKHLPSFRPKGDMRIATEANLKDFLRHTSGLGNPVVTILGPGGKVLVPQNDFINATNNTPTDSNGRPAFRSGFVYSNVGYGLLTLVIEQVSGLSFANFVQQRILDPLGMRHTVVFEERLQNSTNVAHAWAQMEDGSWELLEHEWTSEHNSPVLGMVGIRSCVEDMLVFNSAVMAARSSERQERGKSSGEGVGLSDFAGLKNVKSPLSEMTAILDKAHVSRPHNDPFQNKANYHFGWVKGCMPSCMLSYGCYNSILAGTENPEHNALRDDNIIGKASSPMPFYKSSGIGICGSVSVSLFPETGSAVVVLSNGLDAGDAADFAAGLLIEVLFDLTPKINTLLLVETEIESRKAAFGKMMRDLEQHRDTSTPEADHAEFVGRYNGLGINLVIRESGEAGRMELCLNSREDAVQQLEFYSMDTYSYWPKTRDQWLKGGWLDWDFYMVGLLSFQKGSSGAVTGVSWVWEKGAEPFLFVKAG